MRSAISEEPSNGSDSTEAVEIDLKEPIEKDFGHSGNSSGRNEGNENLSRNISNLPPEPLPPVTFMDKIKKIWAKTPLALLDIPTMKLMAKGALAPTIALAAYQATDFAETYTTLGYLVGITSILSFPIMPRAKFLQTWIFNILSTCISACVSLLAIFCATQARQHTETTPDSTAYNSSAAAVAGIWLFFMVYLANSVRARNPQFMIPAIIWCIFANVSMAYAPQFASMTTGISFVKRLLESFMTGFAIGGGVGLFIFPVTMRFVVFSEMTGYIMTLRKVVGANMTYLRSLEQADPFFRADTNIPEKPKRSPEARAVKETLAALTALHGKLAVDLVLAKREVALGKLGPDDIQEIFRHLRGLLLPVMGLSSVIDVFERSAEDRHWDHAPPNKPLAELDQLDRDRIEAVEDWHAIMAAMREPFTEISEQIDQGLLHVLLTLQLIKPPKKTSDDESSDGSPQPGGKGFAEYNGSRVNRFHYEKDLLLKRWCKLRNIELAPDFFEHPETAEFNAPEWYHAQSQDTRRNHRSRLYIVVYMDFLLDSIARSVHEFVMFAEAKAASGKMGRRHLIVPGFKRLRKWILNSWSRRQDEYSDGQHGMNEDGNSSSNIWLGDAYKKRKDPEHLPPRNRKEQIGNRVRGIAHFLRSPESAFGFRVASATMCLAIIAYLHDTQTFYVKQRLFWAQIMVTISMTPSAGQSLFSFLLRIIGTAVAMVTSLVAWYIVDGNTAGVLVFFWFFVSWGFFVMKNYPRLISVGMVYSITNTLIIGYELQTLKIGIATSESNGQAYYPIYELAPYRLATVCAGLFVAFVWTIFPFPISEHSELRRNLGSSLYLLANYYSVVTETVRTRLRGDTSDMKDKNSPARRLEKMHQTVFAKSMLLLQALRNHSSFTRVCPATHVHRFHSLTFLIPVRYCHRRQVPPQDLRSPHRPHSRHCQFRLPHFLRFRNVHRGPEHHGCLCSVCDNPWRRRITVAMADRLPPSPPRIWRDEPRNHSPTHASLGIRGLGTTSAAVPAGARAVRAECQARGSGQQYPERATHGRARVCGFRCHADCDQMYWGRSEGFAGGCQGLGRGAGLFVSCG